MSSVLEVHTMFNRLRDELGNDFEKKQEKYGKGQEDKKAEAAQLWLYMQMGLFVAESLIVDIKRIANALDGGNPELGQGITQSLYELAMNTQPRGS
jgi:hypothetical protein